MADIKQETHRPGALKQQNKAHKHGKHSSKGAIDMKNKGRVELKALAGKKRGVMRKIDRRNQMKQLRANKRQETLLAKRSLGIDGSPPHVIVCIPLNGDKESSKELHSLLCSAAGEDDLPFSSATTVVFTQLKKRITFLFPPVHDLYTVLDTTKVADTILLVHNSQNLQLSTHADLCLDCLAAQGLPTTTHAVMGMSDLTMKKKSEIKQALQKSIGKWFPKEKFHPLDTTEDALSVVRFIGNQKLRPVYCRDMHPHIVAEKVTFEADEDNEEVGTLCVSGYVRARPFSVNRLVHVTGLRDFQLSMISSPRDPHQLRPHKQTRSMETMITEEQEEMEEDVKMLLEADPTKQEPLVSEVELDPMAAEQTWPTEEDEEQAATDMRRVDEDYQAAWIDEDIDDEEEEEISDSDDDTVMSTADMDSESGVVNDASYDNDMDMAEEERQLQMLRAEKDDQLFPDEVDTPLNMLAKTRFARYRGLKSFRSSPWDPKENLPRDYARIVQFQNFKRFTRRVLSTVDDDGVLPGWYVTLHIKAVPRLFAANVDIVQTPLVVHSLLPFENKMSVVNFCLKRSLHYTQPIKSKDRLIFHCGVHRFSSCPIFSQHTASNKHKFERFLPSKGVSVASVLAPIGFPPSPVLVFKESAGTQILVATGTLHSVNPDRIVCKKIVLSGHLYKIHRRSAVVRYMFFNRDDIMWFKPVELRTRCGLRGHIKEPLGTHGHMKCIFDKHIKPHDTVLMSLYKRVFPKWTYQPDVPRPIAWGRGSEESDQSECSMHV